MVRIASKISPLLVAGVAVLIFLESFIGGFIAVAEEGSMPSDLQWLIIAGVAALALITYLLSILRPGK